MKPETIKASEVPATARNSARINEKRKANLPNDFGKSWREK